MAIMEARGVYYTYGNKYRTVRAVNGVDYTFSPGRLYAVVGKSGSGKTTLLSMLAGLDLPTEGDIFFNGESTRVVDRDNLRRDSIAVIYQNYNLFPLFTALENTMYPLKLKKQPTKEAKQAAKEKLIAVGLCEEHFPRFPAMLSGGEQQRVAIARALAGEARVILADEPTGNLDTENGKNIVAILKRLAHEEGKCVLIVTHDPSIADEADEVLRMKDGRIENTESAGM
jgi:putative ABC transport system ATP-binding protein